MPFALSQHSASCNPPARRPRRVPHLITSICALLLLVMLTACDVQTYSSSITDFSTACTSVVQQTKDDYQLVNDAIVELKILDKTKEDGPLNGKVRETFTPLLSSDEIQIRTQLLDELLAYANALAGLTGKTPSEIDTEATKLGASLHDLATNGRLQTSFHEIKGVTQEETNAAATAVDEIANLIMNHQLAKELPAILATTTPRIQAITTIFDKELGQQTGNKDDRGLRHDLWLAYDDQIDTKRSHVNEKGNSPQRQKDLETIVALINAQQAADASLAKTQAALRKLAAAHQALHEVNTKPATFKAAIAAVWAEAKDAQDFYAKLPTK